MKWKLKTQIDKGCELFSFWQDEQFKYKCSHSLRYILTSMSAERRKDFCLKWSQMSLSTKAWQITVSPTGYKMINGRKPRCGAKVGRSTLESKCMHQPRGSLPRPPQVMSTTMSSTIYWKVGPVLPDYLLIQKAKNHFK